MVVHSDRMVLLEMFIYFPVIYSYELLKILFIQSLNFRR
jgi:hypothetical protein